MPDRELAAAQPFSVCPLVSAQQVAEQVQRIQEIMRAVMTEGEHYGKIPGCDPKPTLLKPGAEKLALAFGLAAEFTTIGREVENAPLEGHREYDVTCRLISRQTGAFVGEGVGICSTMETRYRWRTDYTGKRVPGHYWADRDQRKLGGPGFQARKVKGDWYIVRRVEHDNPADYYNTVKKIAKKRAYVDAILTVTAASDLFTQDLEDLPAEVRSQEHHSTTPVGADPPPTSDPEPGQPVTGKPATATARPASAQPTADGGSSKPAAATDKAACPLDCGIEKVGHSIRTVNGQKVNVYGVDTDKGRFHTFNEQIAADLTAIGKRGARVSLWWQDTPKGRRITAVDEVKQQ